ncbi:MAG TPA: hypothetical protein VGL72_20905 [Bryobacteraceae bacterium]|jgi:hypothetical protein
MSIPPIPPPLEHLGNRKFSFYPPILNIERNEWTYHQATWSEILVTNVHTGQEVWVPRRFLGEVSRVDDPVLIVGLNKELEYSGGAVWPHRRRVIEMPVAVNDRSAPVMTKTDGPKEPAPVIGIRLEPTEARAGRMVAGVLTVSVVGCMVIATIARQSQFRQRVTYTAHDESYTELNKDDDYFAVIRKLGPPSNDNWSAASGAVQYRTLAYPKLGYTVVLFGADRKNMRYLGSFDLHCNPVHGISYADGTSSSAMLRNVARAVGCEAG